MMPLNEFLTANTSLVKGFLSDLAVCEEDKERRRGKGWKRVYFLNLFTG